MLYFLDSSLFTSNVFVPRFECSNAELIEQITGIDFMSNSVQSPVSKASNDISEAGHSVASILSSVNNMVTSEAWGTFEQILGVGEDFAVMVGPLINPLSPITDLLKAKIEVPWVGKIYKKKNLGKVACELKSKCGYDSKKGAFGDKCWEVVSWHFRLMYMYPLPNLFVAPSRFLRSATIYTCIRPTQCSALNTSMKSRALSPSAGHNAN